jgi:ionotropic kainate glutamate receptor 2
LERLWNLQYFHSVHATESFLPTVTAVLLMQCLELMISVHAGGLFHPADDRQEVAFRYAVERINDDRSILPRSRLSAQIERISPQDSFHASKRGEHSMQSVDRMGSW